MTHEEFVKRAQQTARTTQGLRRLAPHVRRLYSAIRTLQHDDNGFFYIGEVIQFARNDKTDPLNFATRVKTYYHRDRVALGDPLVPRGMPPPATGVSHSGANPRSGPSTIHADPAATLAYPMSHPDPTVGASPVLGMATDTQSQASGLQDQIQADSIGEKTDGAARTAALHARQRGRRVVPGG